MYFLKSMLDISDSMQLRRIVALSCLHMYIFVYIILRRALLMSVGAHPLQILSRLLLEWEYAFISSNKVANVSRDCGKVYFANQFGGMAVGLLTAFANR